MLGALASGDLSRRVTVDYQGTLGELKDHANRTAEQLAEIVGQIQIATEEVKNAASEISSGTADLSSRTEQAASNLEETAASTEEMAANVKQNADNAKNASQLAGSADQSAKTGGQVVEQSVSAMAGIEISAKKITDIISVLDAIAFQTNLLELNTRVEAARAGEAGKGFAVVAQEVRQLAHRAGNASNDLKKLIQDSNGQVKQGVELVNRAGEALTEIVGSIGRVAGIVEEMSSASQKQAMGVQEINSSITAMDEMTQQNSALVEESTAAARALSDQAGRLAELMAFFKLDGAQETPGATARSVKHPPARVSTDQQIADVDEGWSEF
jgi:methyl-accepting chemotaxis protein